MISKESLVIEWINKVSSVNRKADKILVEKIIRAFLLLEGLSNKAAYAAILIKYDAKKLEKYNNPLQMKDWIVGKPLWLRINRLKRSNPEAFFYWYKIYELITQTN